MFRLAAANGPEYHRELYELAAQIERHLSNFIDSLANIVKAASWLAVAFSMAGLFIAALLVWRSDHGTKTKLLGAIFVTGLCFAANHVGAYSPRHFHRRYSSHRA